MDRRYGRRKLTQWIQGLSCKQVGIDKNKSMICLNGNLEIEKTRATQEDYKVIVKPVQEFAFSEEPNSRCNLEKVLKCADESY